MLIPLYDGAIASLDGFLRIIQDGNIAPEQVDRHGQVAVRFTEMTPEEALLLKFGRLVSLNKVLAILIKAGFIQEQCIIQRCIEETNEDIAFISANVTGTAHSEKFELQLNNFWKEDFEDPNNPAETIVPRWFSRKGIPAFLNRLVPDGDASRADKADKVLNSMYSGFVHSAAPQILELYDLDQRAFLTDGLLGTNRHIDYVVDAKNVIYRSLCSAGFVGKAFGSEELFAVAKAAKSQFEKAVGWEEPRV